MIGKRELTDADDRFWGTRIPDGLDGKAVHDLAAVHADRAMVEIDRETTLTADEDAAVRTALRIAFANGLCVGVFAARAEGGRRQEPQS